MKGCWLATIAGWFAFRGDVACKKPSAASCSSGATGVCNSLEGETDPSGNAGSEVSWPNIFTMIKIAVTPMIQFLTFDNRTFPHPRMNKAKLYEPVEFKASVPHPRLAAFVSLVHKGAQVSSYLCCFSP